jgi:hypothetical protein
LAIAAPIPLLPPVTKAVFPPKLIDVIGKLHSVMINTQMLPELANACQAIYLSIVTEKS